MLENQQNRLFGGTFQPFTQDIYTSSGKKKIKKNPQNPFQSHKKPSLL
jgi:hypothetical protein